MERNEPQLKTTADGDDAVAELIRAAGRRPSPPAAHYASVRAVAHDAWRQKLASRRRRRVSFALAASVALAVALGVTLQLIDTSPTSVGRVALVQGTVELRTATGEWVPLTPDAAGLTRGARVRTGAASGAAFALDDGLALRVAAASELTLAAADAVELLAGTIYVDSGDDGDGEAIRIETNHGTVTDVGTQFEVMSADESLRVRVRSGLIRLSGPSLASELAGGRGDELELYANGAIEQRAIAPSDEAWAWAEALAVVPASGLASIRQYMEWIAKETGQEIRFDRQSTEIEAELRDFNGDPTGLTPDELLDFIVRVSDFEYQRLADGVILIQRK